MCNSVNDYATCCSKIRIIQIRAELLTEDYTDCITMSSHHIKFVDANQSPSHQPTLPTVGLQGWVDPRFLKGYCGKPQYGEQGQSTSSANYTTVMCYCEKKRGLAATLRGSRPGVQSASFIMTLRRPPRLKTGNDVIIWVQDGNCKKWRENFSIGAFYNEPQNP